MTKQASAKYYQKTNKIFFKKSRGRYQNISDKEKNKKREYDRERYKNLLEDEKQNLFEYRIIEIQMNKWKVFK